MIRKTVKFTFKSFIIFILILTTISIVYLWLITKPHSLNNFSPTIENALNESIAPYKAEFDSIEMSWSGWQQSPVVDIKGLTIRDGDTLLFYSASTKAVLSFSELLKGAINPLSIKLDSPVLDFSSLTKKPALDSLEQTSEKFHPLNISNTLPGLIKNFDLEEIEIVNGQISVLQSGIGIANLIMSINREDSLAKITVQSGLLLAEQPVSMLGDLNISAIDSFVTLDLFMVGLPSKSLAQLFPGSVFKDFQADFDINVNVLITPADSLKRIDFNVSTQKAIINNPAIFIKPVTLSDIQMSGKVTENLHTISGLKIISNLDESKLEIDYQVYINEEYPQIDAEINFTNLPVDSLSKYWPYNLEKNTREWLVENLSDGIIRKLKAKVAVGPEDFKIGKFDLNKLDLQIQFDNLSAKYYSILPNIKTAVGTARLSERILMVDLKTGRFRDSNIRKSTFRLEGIGGEQQNIIVDVFLSGPAENIAKSVLDLGAVKDTTFKPVFKIGKAFSHLKMHFPLNRELTLDDYNIDATCTTKELSFENIYGLDFTDATLEFRLKDGKLFSEGKSKVNDLPVNLQWQQNLTGSDISPPIFTFDANASNEQLMRFGIPHIDNFSGDSKVHLTLLTKDSLLSFNGKIDLTYNRFHSEYLGWQKNFAEPAVLTVRATKSSNDSILNIQNFKLTGNNMFVQGNGAVSTANSLYFSVLVDTVRAGKHNFNGIVESNPYDGLNINIAGESMDLQPVIQNILFKKADVINNLIPGNNRAKKSGKVTVYIKTKHMYLLNNEELKDVNSVLQIDSSQIITGNIFAKLSEEDTFLSFYPGKKKNNLQIKTQDGGALLRGFGIYDHVIKGDFSLSADVKTSLPAGPVEGTMTLKNYSLKDAPAMAKILSLAALLGEAGLLSNQGIPFSQMDAEFYMRDNIIHVKNSKMAGSALIMSANGKLVLNNNLLDLKGVIYPLTTINNILSSVPLIGNIAKNVRVLGTSYEMKGTFDDAKISVNPLSILLPGFLRDFGDLLVKDTIDTLNTN